MGLDTVDLVIKIENHFSIRIPDAEAEKMALVRDVYAVVAKHLQAKPEQMPLLQTAINNIIAEHAGLALSQIEPHKSLTSDLGLD